MDWQHHDGPYGNTGGVHSEPSNRCHYKAQATVMLNFKEIFGNDVSCLSSLEPWSKSLDICKSNCMTSQGHFHRHALFLSHRHYTLPILPFFNYETQRKVPRNVWIRLSWVASPHCKYNQSIPFLHFWNYHYVIIEFLLRYLNVTTSWDEWLYFSLGISLLQEGTEICFV